MAGNNSGGPWGGGEDRGDQGGNDGGGRGPSGGGNRPEMPEIDEIVRKGQEQLRVLMGGKGKSGGGSPSSGGNGLGAGGIGIFLIAAFALWLFASFYRVDTSEQSVELFFGKYLSLIHI